MNEAQLRDWIAADLGVIEPGLDLLDKEKFIPNPLGTRGFIDLYAKDAAGHHVLIELKRSDSSAREAIHEIHKYADGVKRHLGVRDEELRIIVASTEWTELIVPFSHFCAETSLAASGVRLVVDESTRLIEASKIELIPAVRGRVIAPWHDVHWHIDRASLDGGLRSIDSCCAEKGVKDYVVLVIEFPNDRVSEHEVQIIEMLSAIAAEQGVTPHDVKLPTYRFIAYFAVQPLQEDVCMGILRRDAEIFDEANEVVDGMGDEERLKYLNEQVISLPPNPMKDHFEIGYGAKLTKFLDQQEGEVISVIRRGIFARNQLLTDAVIVSEMRGEDGATGQRFRRTIDFANRAHVSSARSDIGSCLDQNHPWKSHIFNALDEILDKYPTAQVDASIYNPAAGLLTIHYSTSREDGALFVPTYALLVRNFDVPQCMYFGVLQTCGPAMPLRRLINKYYDGDLFGLLMTSSWGGREERDVDILEDFGLEYRSFRCDLAGEEKKFYALRDGRWRSTESINFLMPYYAHLEANVDVVKELNKKLSDRLSNGIYSSTSIRRQLDEIVSLERAERAPSYFTGPPTACDLCGCPFAEETYMIDGAVIDAGHWAFMCQECFEISGHGIAWGAGQLYRKDSNGWLLVAGFPPEDLQLAE